MSEFSRETLLNIIETDHVQCGEASALARMALAAIDSEPVAYMYRDNLHSDARFSLESKIGNWSPEDINEYEITETPLYRHAQPALVGNEFIPKNLDRALGVLGMALPESKEEFNLQSERWIQRLIDRVIRYADEFQEQPTPVVPEEWTITHAVKFCKETGRQDAGTAMDAWNACRAAMLQAGTLTNEDTRQVDELTMWIKRLVRSLKKASPDSKLHSEAMDYLTAKGLISVGVGGALR
ncbi:Uncharacterised protein [Klebsiella pneumoniae]|uniref:hypothetical protein n=1 Tax=Klebsiella pneumoniae TaxID=573 RepID=UPI000E2B355E|nr:hypothetical protein [Klebsiella pneumoniae]VVL78685.1 Uncharacterised protein [Klebsiella pneumoniae]